MNLDLRWAPVGLFVLATACGGDPAALQDSRHPTGSQTMALSEARDAVVVAHTHEGTVGRIGLDGSLSELRLDGEPTRVAQANGKYFVTLRQARSLVVLEAGADGALAEVKRITMGAEPFGVVAAEGNQHIYVAVALEGLVREVDTQTLEVTRTFEVEGEPRWLAFHPDGVIFAVSAWNGHISAIDIGSGDVSQFRLPAREGQDFQTGRDFELDRRASGDPAVTPDGRQLLVPAMYLDTDTPIQEPTSLDDLGEDIPQRGEGGGGYSADRFNPVVVAIPVGQGGKLHTTDASVVSVISHTNTVDFEFRSIIGYPTSVTVTPDGTMMLVSIEGAAGVSAIATQFGQDQNNGFFDSVFGGNIFDGGISFWPTAAVGTDAGPRGVVAIDDSSAVVFNFLDRTVQSFELNGLRSQIVQVGGGDDRFVAEPHFESTQVAKQISVSTQATLDPEIEAGRRLFYSTGDSRMSADGSGLSCSTCHFDGRTDGLSWAFDRGERQTPSLAGQVSLTEPVRWEGDRATVKEDARFTSQGLMGGSDILEEELDAVVAFIDFTPRVDSPLRDSQDEAVLRGKSIFERSDVGCASCHNGVAYTDNQTYSMFELPEVQTRSLVGVAGSPPYFHDGSAETLRDVLERVRDGSMGDTSSLNDSEMADLERYLRSL